MLARRIIPCLDVKDGRVVKGVRFRGHEDMGDPVELAARYRDQGADELVFYDITASAEDRTLDYDWVRAIAAELDIPFCVAGGVRSVKQALACLESGADKVSINSPALERPGLIGEIAATAGSQCVVLGVDSLVDGDDYVVHQYTGSEATSRASGRKTLDWIVEAQDRGAGEVVLNCMNQDGVRKGYDIAQLKAARARLTIPLIASGGAGSAGDFRDVFEQADVSGALAASVFHKGILTVPDLKADLADAGVAVRL
ncbi:MAG TPA: imidazole glycerol phosphate synthase subunit HisF [Caulobacteraceae bacterium]|jgi:cyclase